MLLNDFAVEGDKQVFACLEVLVEGPLRQARTDAKIGNRRGREPLAAEQLERGAEQLRPPPSVSLLDRQPAVQARAAATP